MLEAVGVKGVPEFTGVSEAGSDGLALRVKELMAHLEHKWLLSGKKLQSRYKFQVQQANRYILTISNCRSKRINLSDR